MRGWMRRLRGEGARSNDPDERRTDGGVAVDGASGGADAAAPDEPDLGGLAPDVDAGDEAGRLRYERDYWRGMFEQVIEAHPEPTFVIDDDDVVAYLNSAAEAGFRMEKDAVVGESVYDVFPIPDDAETFAQTVAREGEARTEDDYRHVTVGDSDGWLKSSGVPLRDPDGSVVAGLETASDVTELVEQKEAMSRAQAQISEGISATADETANAADRVGDAVHEASSLADEQAESMDEVSGEVGSLSATVEEIAASADEVNERSEKAEHLAAESTESGEQAVDTMEEVAESGEAAAQQTRELAEQVAEIDDIVEVINDIADQTNILALNANIEAARAGEAGEGFAVVANEVKSLANEVQTESERIEEIIRETREDAGDTVESIESVTDEVRDSADAVREMVENQEAIMAEVSATSTGMEDIASATDDQAVRTEEVASMVDAATKRSKQVREEVDAAAEANEDQLRLVAEITSSLDSLESTVSEMELRTGGNDVRDSLADEANAAAPNAE